MFLKMRKSREPSEKKSPQEGDTTKSEKLDQGTDETAGTIATKVTNLEEVVNERTKGLEETEEQLKELSNTVNSTDEDKDEAQIEGDPAQPHQPKSELSVQPEEEDLSTLLGKVDDEEEEGEPTEEGQNDSLSDLFSKDEEEEGEQTEEGQSDSLADLFSQDEEEENPLAGLIASLPNLTAKEVLDELEEIKAMVLEWQQH